MPQKKISPAKDANFIDLKSILLKYMKYWKWFVVSGLACLVLAIIYMKVVDPVYSVQASILIKTDKEAGSGIESSMVKAVGLSGLTGSENVEDEIGIISSQSIMREMIKKLNLETRYTLKKFPFDKELYNNSPLSVTYDPALNDTLSGVIEMTVKIDPDGNSEMEMKYNKEKVGNYSLPKIPAILKTEMGIFNIDTIAATGKNFTPGKSYKMKVQVLGLDFAAENFRKYINFAMASRKSNIIWLSYENKNRELAKDIINTLIDLYNQDGLDDKKREAIESAKFISDQIEIMTTTLDTIERQVEAYKIQNNVTDPKVDAEYYGQSMLESRKQEITFDVQMGAIQMLDNYVKNPENRYSLVPVDLVLPENSMPVIQSYNSLLLERERLLKNGSETNPTVISLDKQIELSRQNVYVTLEQVKNEVSASKRKWSSETKDLQSRLENIPSFEREYANLQRQQKTLSELYVFLLKKKAESELKVASEVPKSKIIDRAFPTFKPVSPRLFRVLGVALLFALLIPVLILYIRDLFKFKFSTKEELQDHTTVPVLGEICHNKWGEKVVVKEGKTNSIIELFRLMRTNIQFILQKAEKVILITSSIAGEGKSFFTLNLALSFALIKGKKVMIVGLDIRSPKMTEYLEIKNRTGLTSYLASDEMEPKDIVVPLSSIHPSLYFIPAGPIPPNPSELLLRERLDDLFAQLRQQYDYILVDTAPVGMVSDTFALKRISDMTLYLFRANYTHKSNLKTVEYVVNEDKLKNVSLVINGTNTKAAYGYGYGVNHQKK